VQYEPPASGGTVRKQDQQTATCHRRLRSTRPAFSLHPSTACLGRTFPLDADMAMDLAMNVHLTPHIPSFSVVNSPMPSFYPPHLPTYSAMLCYGRRCGCGHEHALESSQADAQGPQPHQRGPHECSRQHHSLLHPARQLELGYTAGGHRPAKAAAIEATTCR
jgi:hypothetical protein